MATLADRHKTSAGSAPGARPAPVLPLSAGSARSLGQVGRALRDPAFRASLLAERELPAPVERALRVLDDNGFKAAVEDIGGLEARAGRRALFQGLRERHPEAMGAFRAARGRARLGTVIVYFFVNMVAGPVQDLDFDEC
jgi:hypothetical protein